jgi:hypothetical protein
MESAHVPQRMSRLRPLFALFLSVLWLPAVLHCELEAANIQLLTHDHHHEHDLDHAHHAADQHDANHGHGSDEGTHALDDTPFTATAPGLKVLPPADAVSPVLLALLSLPQKLAEPALSPERHPPPLELAAAWQFVSRAAPPARAPNRA